MGNCLFGALGEEPNEVVKVITSNGGIMEFVGPIAAECITDEFPGHGIFRNKDLFWSPLPHQEFLTAGESYYLLPLRPDTQVGHVRSNSVPESSIITSYRMSFDGHGSALRRSYKETSISEQLFAAPRYTYNKFKNGSGVWKVKLVISPNQLLDILSQEGRTQELIESVRTVAKCGNIGLSSLGFSDQWSLSSRSVNANSSKKSESTILEI